mgnify:FL=1
MVQMEFAFLFILFDMRINLAHFIDFDFINTKGTKNILSKSLFLRYELEATFW